MAEASNHIEFAYSRLKKEEGVKPRVYRDTKNKRTVGIGLNLDDPTTASLVPLEVRLGLRDMTPTEMEVATKQRLALAEKDAQDFVGPDVYQKLDPLRKAALVDMSYNMGQKALFSFENARKAIQAGDFVTAGKEILNSKYAKVDAPNRAKRNARLMQNAYWDVEPSYMRYEVMERKK